MSESRELTTQEIESVAGCSGRMGLHGSQPAADTSRPRRFGFWRFFLPSRRSDDGCPGPVPLPPSSC